MEPTEIIGLLVEEVLIKEISDKKYKETECSQKRYKKGLQSIQDNEQNQTLQIGEVVVENSGAAAEFSAMYSLLDDKLNDVSVQNRLDTVFILDWFLRSMPENSGSPEHFLPIHGDLLPVVEAIYSPSIIYIWRQNCDPCELVVDDLEDIFEFPPKNIRLFSIYGPEHTDLLKDRYDVIGGPTILFLANGSVDARLHGAHNQEVLEAEIEKIQERG